jgi:uncharacterized protein YabE (DUF348 family)
LIVNYHKATALLASVLTLGFIVVSHSPARADVSPAVLTSAPAPASAGANVTNAPTSVLLSTSGHESLVTTAVRTVEALLAERGIHVGAGDYLSADAQAPLTTGMHVAYRPAVPLVFVDGGLKQTVRTSAATVGELLDQQHVTLRARDQVFPAPGAYLVANEVVRVDRIDAWTDRVKQRLAPRIQERFDARLPAGTTKTVARGSSGVRVATVRYERRNDQPLTKRVLGYQILRAPSPRIVVHGSRPYSALSDMAAQGFSGALRFAGAALHVIATAYTSSCYGCSGFTASGARAGLGIIAVDPRVIPLGTHLFIPGYGRAVAGDTGGAIVGHRVDLGFANVASALRFGSREVTVYVVK